MFELRVSKLFERKYKKITKNNHPLKKKVVEVLEQISDDPFVQSLRTHKVNANVGRNLWSSKVTADLRVIWDFSEEVVNVIDVVDIGGHSGKDKVYL